MTKKSSNITKKINDVSEFQTYLKPHAAQLRQMAYKTRNKQLDEKEINSPSTNLMRKFIYYVELERKRALKKLKKQFDFESWMLLLRSTSVLTLIFNCRSVGEHSRIEIKRYIEAKESLESVSYYRKLNENEKIYVSNYFLVELKGKLEKTCSSMVNEISYIVL